MDSRRFIPTDIGKIVNRFLTQYFQRYVEYSFTAEMEDELDAVSRGEEDWKIPLQKFWKPFIDLVESTDKNVSREQVAQARELGKDVPTGKPITVRMGRFGPFVQIGTKDDADKPRFAGLRPGQKMDLITLAEALELFKLPRTLGTSADGAVILANVGRFGPYIKYGPKYVSMKDDDPYTVTLERALELIRLKQEADANRLILEYADAGIQVLNGRYGPYITDGKKNAKVPKDREPKSVTLEECRQMLEAAPARGSRFGRGKRGGAPKAAAEGVAAAATDASAAPAAPARGKRAARAGAKAAPAAKAPPAATPPTATVRAATRPAARPAAARGAAARPAGARAAASRPVAAQARARSPSLKTKSPARMLKAAAKRARIK
jgi:DNA topoisomerase-1